MDENREEFFSRKEMYEEFHGELGDVRSDIQELQGEIDRAIVKMREYNDLRENMNVVMEATTNNSQAIQELQSRDSAWEYVQDHVAWWMSGILSIIVMFYYFGVI